MKRRRAALVAAVLALAVIAAWLVGSRDAGEPRGASSPSIASSRADAGALAAAPFDGGVAPPKPTDVTRANARTAAPPPSYPWANEQPPPDYLGEPLDGGGRPMPAKAPPDYDVLDEAQLDARRRDTIAFLDERIEELERREAHADENGQSELAASLRAQRLRIESRRDALRELVSRDPAE